MESSGTLISLEFLYVTHKQNIADMLCVTQLRCMLQASEKADAAAAKAAEVAKVAAANAAAAQALGSLPGSHTHAR